MPQFDDDLLLGPVVPGGPYSTGGLLAGNRAGGSSPMTRGIGPLGREFVYDIVPAALVANNIALSQTPGGAGNLVLTAGAGVTKVTRADGTVAYQLDVPRGVSITSAADDSGHTFTVNGFDIYGQAMSQALVGAAGAPGTVTTKKAFYQVTSIAISAAAAGAVTVGTADLFGLPVSIPDIVYLGKIGWDSILLSNAGTAVKADATTPATNATGDVRGTYTQSGNASNGVRRLVIGIRLGGLAVGPDATRIGALGVTQA